MSTAGSRPCRRNAPVYVSPATDGLLEVDGRLILSQPHQAIDLDGEEWNERPLRPRAEKFPIGRRHDGAGRRCGVGQDGTEELEAAVAKDQTRPYGVERAPGGRPVGDAEETPFAPCYGLPTDAKEAGVRSGRVRLGPSLVGGGEGHGVGLTDGGPAAAQVPKAGVLEYDARLRRRRAARSAPRRARSVSTAAISAVEIGVKAGIRRGRRASTTGVSSTRRPMRERLGGRRRGLCARVHRPSQGDKTACDADAPHFRDANTGACPNAPWPAPKVPLARSRRGR